VTAINQPAINVEPIRTARDGGWGMHTFTKFLGKQWRKMGKLPVNIRSLRGEWRTLDSDGQTAGLL